MPQKTKLLISRFFTRTLALTLTAWFTFSLGIGSHGLLVLSTAQAAAPAAYLDSEAGFGDRPYVSVDGEAYPYRFWSLSVDLEEAMKSNSVAQEYARLHKSYSVQSAIGLYGGLGTSILYSLITSRDNHNSGISFALLMVGLLYGVYNAKQSQYYLYRAINTYNGVQYKTEPSAFFEQPRLNPIGNFQQNKMLSMGWSF